MEIIFLIIGLVLGFVIAYFLLKSQKQDLSKYIDPLTLKINSLEIEKSVLEERNKSAVNEKDSLTLQIKNQQEELTQKAKLEIDRVQTLFQNQISQQQEAFAKEKEALNTQLLEVNTKFLEVSKSLEKSRAVFQAQEQRNEELKLEMENLQKKFTTEFENIANKILDDKSSKFTEQNKNNLDIILNPLKEKIQHFEKSIEDKYHKETIEKASLRTEVAKLIEMNQKISDDANNLSKALKGDNKLQGNWGEKILEKVLEGSGLVKGDMYEMQMRLTNNAGDIIIPDAVVKLPENKHIIIDSKVSLTAYQNYVSVDNEEERKTFLKDHINSIRNHVRGLSEKNYYTSKELNSPELVLMFLPIESSFGVAVQADVELFNYAWDKRIVIVSPSTLLATLITIASVWRQENQTRNAIQIAEEGGNLYDKFVGFLEDLDKLGKNMEQSKSSFDNAMNKLKTGKGNLVNRVEHLKKLGAKATKNLDKFKDDETELDS